jgi:guanosine-3',5'-bis(diphosphate) 3'-pyrophosphohydrolase
MLAKETQLNNLYLPQWTKEGRRAARTAGGNSGMRRIAPVTLPVPEVTSSAANLLRAASFAAHKHRDQRRKDVEASPYINHPIAVATVLAIEGGVTDEPILVAALLHDTVEDTATTFEELEQEFGRDVAELVREMTDDKSLDKDVRKQLQIAHAPAASSPAKQIKIADKICNIRDISTRAG